ncbi:hypothetical protein QBC37DRAFT_432988 [Rhypophila decipiens]|uniref:BZIP domain-containing protein n=1 Tax=Rhypophila decipiens TaxID=261697 RepID=A0AAN6XW72_9PEZI|nr:hypothetical protein QBC37DRAFT_432988 [Rhypophila decipiens]
MATPTSTTSEPGSPPATRSGRSQTISYADLMKPDEDWRNLPNPADRRKIQNRLAQRAYRRSLRDRNKEVKRLKKQLEMLEESQGLRASGSPAPGDQQTPGSCPDSPHQVGTPLSMADSQQGMSDYLQAWPQTTSMPGSEQNGHPSYWGQVVSPDLDFGMDFDSVPELLLSPESESGHHSNCHGKSQAMCTSPPTPQYSPYSHPMGPVMSSSDHHYFNMDSTASMRSAYNTPPYGSPSPLDQYSIDPMLTLEAMSPTSLPANKPTSHPMDSKACCCGGHSHHHGHHSGHSRHSRSPSVEKNINNWQPMLQGLGIDHINNNNKNMGMNFAAPTPNTTTGNGAGASKVVAFLIQYNADGTVQGMHPASASGLAESGLGSPGTVNPGNLHHQQVQEMGAH